MPKPPTHYAEEITIMQNHVHATEKLLSIISFIKQYNQVTQCASAHHEYLDGSGYPKRLAEEGIPSASSLYIFDALTAIDRPYKKSAAA